MAATRDRIVEAALDLVAARGLSEVTMIEIARTAGVARATLYNHYPDVASILADAAARHNEQAVAGLRRSLAVVGTPIETIAQLVRYVAAISAHGHTLTAHHGLPPDLQQRLRGFDDELDRQIATAVGSGVELGELRPDLDIATTTTLVRHLLAGVSELVAESPDRAADIVRDATRTILAAIAAAPPDPPASRT